LTAEPNKTPGRMSERYTSLCAREQLKLSNRQRTNVDWEGTLRSAANKKTLGRADGNQVTRPSWARRAIQEWAIARRREPERPSGQRPPGQPQHCDQDADGVPGRRSQACPEIADQIIDGGELGVVGLWNLDCEALVETYEEVEPVEGIEIDLAA
jgi:hypothetical protein